MQCPGSEWRPQLRQASAEVDYSGRRLRSVSVLLLQMRKVASSAKIGFREVGTGNVGTEVKLMTAGVQREF